MSIDNIDYGYITDDNRELKQHYMYSSFQGIALITSYKKVREEAIKFFVKHSGGIEPNTVDAALKFSELAKSSTFPFTRNSPSLAQSAKLDKYVHSFEIRKRVYGEYGLDDRPLDTNDYRNTEPYVSFAFVLSQKLDDYHGLRYLNSFLKLNDAIISFRTELTRIEAEIMTYVLTVEMDAVSKLMERKGLER